MPRKNHPKRPLKTMKEWFLFQDCLFWRIFEKNNNKKENLEFETDTIEKEQGKYKEN